MAGAASDQLSTLQSTLNKVYTAFANDRPLRDSLLQAHKSLKEELESKARSKDLAEEQVVKVLLPPEEGVMVVNIREYGK